MASVSVSIFLLLLLVVITCDAGKKEHIEKIVIHVPYKIHKHHHIHTKYKIITLPAPNKESTFIYYKHPQIPMGHKEPQVKVIIPPHQTSSISWQHPLPQEHVELQSSPHPHVESVSFKPSIHVTEEKPILQTHVPKFEFKPSIHVTEEKPILQTHVPKFEFKPSIPIPEEKPILHEVPKFEFKPSIAVHEKPILQTHVPKFEFKPSLAVHEKPILQTHVPKFEFNPSLAIQEKPILHTHIPKFEFKPSLAIHEKPILQAHVPKFEFKPSITIHEEKPLLQVHDLIPKLPFKPSIAIHEKPILHEDLIPKFSLKLPEAKPLVSHNIPKFSFKPQVKPILHSHDLISKFPIKPVISFPPKFKFKPMHETLIYKPMIHFPPKIHFFEDSVAHKSSHIYQVVTPKPAKGSSYAVKEPIQGDLPPPTIKPMFKMTKNTKSQKPKFQYSINSIHPSDGLKESLIKPYDPEYEHVGYLIIDGNSQKIVGKDFKDNLNWS